MKFIRSTQGACLGIAFCAALAVAGLFLDLRGVFDAAFLLAAFPGLLLLISLEKTPTP